MPDGYGGSGEGAGGGSQGMGGFNGSNGGGARTYSDASGNVTTSAAGANWPSSGSFNTSKAATDFSLGMLSGNPIVAGIKGLIGGMSGYRPEGNVSYGNSTTGGGMGDSTHSWGGSNIGDALSIASGINAITSGVGSGSGSTTGDPFAPYRSGLAAQYATALQPGGSTNIQDMPGFTQYRTGVLDPAMQQSQRTAAASGMLYSGNEQQALQKIGQQGYYGFMTDYLNRLSTGSGASQNPLGGAQLAANQQSAQQQGIMQGIGAIGQGISGISNLFGGGSNYSNYSDASVAAASTQMPSLTATPSTLNPYLWEEG
jgi:hypothetical protein